MLRSRTKCGVSKHEAAPHPSRRAPGSRFARPGSLLRMRAARRVAIGTPDSMTPELDIVIPVYNEGRNIVPVLAGLSRAVATPARVLICYDDEHDDTLPAIRAAPQAY